MARHISDQSRTQGNGRLREYTRQERESSTHGAIRALHARPKSRETSRKMAEYLRIARGHTT